MNIEGIPLVSKPTKLPGEVLFLNSQKLVGEVSICPEEAGSQSPLRAKVGVAQMGVCIQFCSL